MALVRRLAVPWVACLALLLLPLAGAGTGYAGPTKDPSQATLTVIDAPVTVVNGPSGSSHAGASGETLTVGDRVLTGPGGGAIPCWRWQSPTSSSGRSTSMKPGVEAISRALS